MSTHNPPTLIPIPTVRLTAAVCGATIVFAGLGALACWLAGVQPASTGPMGLLCAIAGSMAGMAPWLMKREVAPLTAAMQQVFAASVRMLVGLGAALALALATNADRPWLFGVFLAGALAALIAEMMVVTPLLRGASIKDAEPTGALTPTTEVAG
ncbi:MAG: hypothetical protein ACF8Q5_06755 [Phycisphaerales bacterium JB040]